MLTGAAVASAAGGTATLTVLLPVPDHRVLMLLACVALAVGAVLYLWLSRERLLGPVGLFLAAIVLWFVMRGVVLFFAPEAFLFNLAGDEPERWSYALTAILLVGLWTTLAIVAYHAPTARWLESTVEKLPFARRELGERALQRTLMLYGLGVLGRLYRVLTGTYIGILQARPVATGLTYETGYDPLEILLGTLLPMLAQIGFVLVAVVASRDRRWRILGIVLLVELAWAYVTGTRGSFLVVGLVLILALHYSGRLSTRKLAVAAPLAIFLVFAVVAPYRQLIGAMNLADLGTLEPGILAAHVGRAWELGFQSTLSDPLAFVRRSVLSRFHGLDSFAGAIRSLSSGHAELAGGSTLFNGAVSSLPRLVVPDRPVLNLGYWFPVHYLGEPRATATVIPMPRMVEFYVNFGVVGVVAGGLIIGHLLRGIRGFLAAFSWEAVVVYVFLAAHFILLVEKPMARALTLWKPVLVLALCLWLVGTVKPGLSGASAGRRSG